MKQKEMLKRLKHVVNQAQTRIDIDAAQNPDLRHAIQIVEGFLKASKRVCYGGQAINAQIPKKDQFYNLETSLPDYDFFTPDDKGDTRALVAALKDAGYTEISERIGIHEGTTKIYVNFTAIADITRMDRRFYERMFERSVTVEGIHYADPIFLRMLMFVELSRPRGMVARWEKVFERLSLLDTAHPLPRCKPGKATRFIENRAAHQSRPAILRYVLKNRRIFMGADIHALYKMGGEHGKSANARVQYILRGKAPVVFMSPDADMDADQLAETLRAKKEQILGFQDVLPAMVALYHDDMLVCLIVQEEACHSIIHLPLNKGRVMRIASLDTLLTFLMGLYYRDDPLIMATDALLCWMRQYVDLLNRYRAHPTKLVPAFSIECSGYQTTFASLLRAKGARIEAARQRIGSGFRVQGPGSSRHTRRRVSPHMTTRKLR